jgi:cytochrome c oxidase subunit 4
MLRSRTLNAVRTQIRPSVSSVAVRHAHALSKPTLAHLDKRWEAMSEEERQDIIEQLAERQKGPWSELTEYEKKAAWFISYGAWGPRRPVHAPGDTRKILLGVLGIMGAAGALFATFRLAAPAPPRTLSKEWQEASNEILAENNANPFTGHNQIQSPSRGLPEPSEDDDE